MAGCKPIGWKGSRRSARTIVEDLERRASRKPEYKSWQREEILDLIQSHILGGKFINEKAEE
jgi:hypothetical protein